MKHFSNKEYNVYVKPVDSEHTDELGIVQFAKEKYIDVPRKIDINKGDRVYCVFDSDPASNPAEKIKQAFDIIKGSKEKGLNCIFSNPCFEVWFVMHYKNPPYGKTAEQMKDIIGKIIQDREKLEDYKETTDIFNILAAHHEEALNRAVQLHKSQEQVYKKVLSHECNPYTNIFEFIQYIEKCKKRNSKK